MFGSYETGHLSNNFEYDKHKLIVSNLWTNTTSAIERYLRLGRIRRLHLIIDFTIIASVPGSFFREVAPIKLVGERILL